MSRLNKIHSMLLKLDGELLRTSAILDSLKYLNPLNAANERKIFFKYLKENKEYNPRFEYRHLDFSPDSILDRFKSFKLGRSPIEQLFSKCIDDIKDTLNLFSAIGTEKFPSVSERIYGKPDRKLMDRAHEILSSNTPHEIDARSISPLDLKEMFVTHLAKRGLNWSVIVSKSMTAKVSVDTTKKRIVINARERFSQDDANRLVVHELGTHVLRSENGAQQIFKIFQAGLPNSLTTEEGLATFMEDKAGLLNNRTKRLYAGRVVGVSLSLEKSFYEVFDELSRFFSVDYAYYITQRIKKGIVETVQPGAFTKDLVYLKGFFLVKDYIAAGGDLNILYTGNIGIEDVPLVKHLIEIGMLKPARMLPDF